MRIGVIGPTGPDHFADNIADALRRMGHEVTQLGSAHARYRRRAITRLAMVTRQALQPLEEHAQRRIVRSALEAGCEVIVNIDSHLSPDAVTMFRKHGVRVAFWFPDCVLGMGRALMLLAPYNALFFKEPHLIERLRSTLDLPAYYLPEACNPRWHRPKGPAGGEPYVVVAGNMYPSRVNLLERLIDKDIPVKIYGPKFPHWITAPRARSLHTGQYLAREEKARVFRSAAVVLNTLHPAEIHGVNARLFEAAGCGAAVLTEFRPVVPDLFKIGDEVLAFNDFDDLMDQATLLLNDSRLGARLGEAASVRAHRDHTYELRLTAILERVM